MKKSVIPQKNQKTKYSYANILFLTILLTAVFSCKKQINEAIVEENTNKVDNNAEIAFPGKNSEGLYKILYNGVEITVQKKGDYYIWMNDIAFDQQTFDSLKNLSAQKLTYIEVGVNAPSFFEHWPKGEVFYTIDNNFSPFEVSMINGAISEWENNTSLTFIQRTNQFNYIRFIRGSSGSGLFSTHIGRNSGGSQVINLEANNFIEGNVIHEIGHAIGFYHEHQRTDRNNFITIHNANIEPGQIFNFNTYAQNGNPGNQLGQNLDFQSIMMYGSFFFSVNSNPTITRLDNTTFTAQRFALSAGDIQTANFIYGPPFAKLRYVLDQNIYVPSPLYTLTTYKVYIDFFSDKACTIPFIPTNSIYIMAYRFGMCQDEYGPGGSYSILSQNLTPNGTNSFYLGENSYDESRDENWNLISTCQYEIYVANGFVQ